MSHHFRLAPCRKPAEGEEPRPFHLHLTVHDAHLVVDKILRAMRDAAPDAEEYVLAFMGRLDSE